MKIVVNVPVEITIDDDAPNIQRVIDDLLWTFHGLTNKSTSGYWRVEVKGDTITQEDIIKAMTKTEPVDLHAEEWSGY